MGWQGSDRNAARTNTMSRFETETLTQEDNLKGLALMNPHVNLRVIRVPVASEEKESPLVHHDRAEMFPTILSPFRVIQAVAVLCAPVLFVVFAEEVWQQFVLVLLGEFQLDYVNR